jgi:hypothetical protein
VSKTWRDAATLTPSLWRQLRLRHAAQTRLTDKRLALLVARQAAASSIAFRRG